MPRSARLGQVFRSLQSKHDIKISRESYDRAAEKMFVGGRKAFDTFFNSWPPARDIRPELIVAGNHQAMIDDLAARVELNIQQAGLSLPSDYFAGEFPTGSFNAQAIVVPEGTLLLLNRGLLFFLYKALRLVTHAMRFVDVGNDGEVVPGSETIDEGELPHDEQVRELLVLVLGYLLDPEDWPSSSTIIPFQTDDKATLAFLLLDSTLKFVLAHEFGHAIGGHLTAERMRSSAVSLGELSGDIEVIRKSWSEEFEADRTAAMLGIVDVPRRVHTFEERTIVNVKMVGPFIFFALDRLINRVRLVFNTQPGAKSGFNDHPPSEMRLAVIKEIYQGVAGAWALEIGTACETLIDGIGNDVVQRLAAQLAARGFEHSTLE